MPTHNTARDAQACLAAKFEQIGERTDIGWTLRWAIYEIPSHEALTRFAPRYGCLGWNDRPTRMPRARVAWSAIVTLPGWRILRGMRSIPTHPLPAM